MQIAGVSAGKGRDDDRHLSTDLEGAPDERLSEADAKLVSTALDGMKPRLLEHQVTLHRQRPNAVGDDHSGNVLRPVRARIRLLEVLRR